jgi:hypothetical protein
MRAFPTSQSEQYPQIIDGGMDLRDYFATKAMCGMITTQPHDCQLDEKALSAFSYLIADAMMEARNANN